MLRLELRLSPAPHRCRTAPNVPPTSLSNIQRTFLFPLSRPHQTNNPCSGSGTDYFRTALTCWIFELSDGVTRSKWRRLSRPVTFGCGCGICGNGPQSQCMSLEEVSPRYASHSIGIE
ncbi:hypothetical protein IscW_ISCW005958 [Ixodes scapularis]|uniref:Uncharacterized protein n=1 Tax=Ixodes scapularis TaxID=6945 RepID=B7PN74_IXOSC|nr:hypothetical protein IscW_ISCW005958 [Ixodes scapularis]|eukprot:XP_002435222.1 hypothetical protein IscW_ISCW005958 [Ixodes scapularis]